MTHTLMRRVAGHHDIRMDGMTDLVMRARGASVFDVGCNRGLVGFEFAANGASVVHGCDNDPEVIQCARGVFADFRSVQSQFEVVDLIDGSRELAVFGGREYDITLMLATYHKLKRIMAMPVLEELMKFLALRTRGYFAWRGTSDKPSENEQEMAQLDDWFRVQGLKRIHTSYISEELHMCAVWRRGN